ANPICERVIGTVRRECLDWMYRRQSDHWWAVRGVSGLLSAATDFVHIFVREHLHQLLLLGIVEPTRVKPFGWVFVGAEQHVPPRYVAVVIFVPTVLMVDS